MIKKTKDNLIIFLTNNDISYPLYLWLKNVKNENIILFQKKIEKKDIIQLNPFFIISYNYRFIINKDIIQFLSNRIINLHISYLPWNRGAYPNIWSFIENTPKGVTIHFIDEGIDTGDILFQKEVYFDEYKETLSSSYKKLHIEIQNLFIENWEKIKKLEIEPKHQPIKGSFHTVKDFEEKISILLGEKGWDISIKELKQRYNKIFGDKNEN